MTVEEAKSEIPDIDTFCKEACNRCSANELLGERLVLPVVLHYFD